ncbi:hypothetical protein HK102_000295 [Quaeritorhiza haematococci]|nr:hypothetical protein HK102_000295 [Quaeritorhiza haematococci]
MLPAPIFTNCMSSLPATIGYITTKPVSLYKYGVFVRELEFREQGISGGIGGGGDAGGFSVATAASRFLSLASTYNPFRLTGSAFVALFGQLGNLTHLDLTLNRRRLGWVGGQNLGGVGGGGMGGMGGYGGGAKVGWLGEVPPLHLLPEMCPRMEVFVLRNFGTHVVGTGAGAGDHDQRILQQQQHQQQEERIVEEFARAMGRWWNHTLRSLTLCSVAGFGDVACTLLVEGLGGDDGHLREVRLEGCGDILTRLGVGAFGTQEALTGTVTGKARGCPRLRLLEVQWHWKSKVVSQGVDDGTIRDICTLCPELECVSFGYAPLLTSEGLLSLATLTRLKELVLDDTAGPGPSDHPLDEAALCDLVVATKGSLRKLVLGNGCEGVDAALLIVLVAFGTDINNLVLGSCRKRLIGTGAFVGFESQPGFKVYVRPAEGPGVDIIRRKMDERDRSRLF